MGTETVATGHWLDSEAADAYLRARRDGLPAGITSAGRTRAEQDRIFRQYYTTNYAASAKFDQRTYQGKKWWRRPGKPSAATPGSPAARHEKGLSLDLPAGGPREWMRANGHNYGWIKDLVSGEPWHFEYQAHKDKGDTMLRTYKSRTADQALAEGKWTTVKVNNNNDLSVLTRAGTFDGQWQATLTGLPKGFEAQVRFFAVNTKTGKVTKKYPVVEVIGTSGSSFVSVNQKGTLAKGERLRVQVNVFTSGVKITSAQSRVDVYPSK